MFSVKAGERPANPYRLVFTDSKGDMFAVAEGKQDRLQKVADALNGIPNLARVASLASDIDFVMQGFGKKPITPEQSGRFEQLSAALMPVRYVDLTALPFGSTIPSIEEKYKIYF